MPIDAQKLEKNFVIEGQGTAAELLTGLDLIAPLEAKLAARPARIRWAGLGALIVCMLLGIATGYGILFMVGVIAGLGFLAKSFFLQTIQKDRIEFFRLLLKTLGR